MRLSQICIDRPVLSIVMSLVILVFGIISLGRLPYRELPDVDNPVVSVITILPGAAPEVMETSITQVIEDELVSIEGIRHITSVSREETSIINLEFELSRDLNVAASDVRDRVALARSGLPDEVKAPIVSKSNSSGGGLIWMDLSGGGLNQIELTTLVETQIEDRLTKLPGVATLNVEGERRLAIRLWIDHHRLTARGLVVADVTEALRQGNVDIPSGRVESVDQEFSVRTPGELRSAEDYNNLIIANFDGKPVRIRDIGKAVVGAENERSLVRVNGEVGLAMGVVKQSKANALDVARAVKAEVKLIKQDLPEGVSFKPVWDQSIFIENSIHDVTVTIFYAIALVLIVIFIFLRSLRATLIPALSIPVSVVGTFALLHFMGYSINILTLMGLTLAIGLVVDDAIVVLENVSRWIEEGTPRLEATRRGMAEISFAVVAASVSVIAVFMPLAFMTGTTGRLFREFGVTVATAVAISGFVALTLAPTLCARVLRTESRDAGFSLRLGQAVDRMRNAYARGLGVSLKVPWIVAAISVAWVALGWLLFAKIDREFVPLSDRGSIMVFSNAPQGSTMEYTNRYHMEVERQLLEIPEISSSVALVAPAWAGPAVVNRAIVFSSLVPQNERERSQMEIVDSLYFQFSQNPGIEVFPMNEPTLSIDWNSSPVSIVVTGPKISKVAAYADEIVRRAREIPGLVNLQSDLKLNKPQLIVHVDREQASDLGVSVRDVASTLQVLLGGAELSTFKMHGETYEVIAQIDRADRANPTDLYGLYVRSESGIMVPLASVVTIEETVTSSGLPHYDRQRAAGISGNLLEGVPLGETLDQLKAIGEEVIPVDSGYRVLFSGLSERFYQSANALAFAYLLAVVMVYLVLAAQFESFVDPATILVAVALSFTGALLALESTTFINKWFGTQLPQYTLNLFSQIGLVMLVGLVTKNSILIVEFANQLRERGAEPFEAVAQAARTRFRPVLMTALSTIAGILPIAIGMGAGGEARAPLGVAVVGGMAFSTLLTIFVIPSVYLGFAHLEIQFAARSARRAQRSDAGGVGGLPVGASGRSLS
ncbi:MAG: efflux RND transporter permease subunit [Deltaproteobacteria bacterium]|nr:efflux RND transporter permease subunit [Deltaproteobacteria bacterium]